VILDMDRHALVGGVEGWPLLALPNSTTRLRAPA
jgi:hypothetical protein